MTCVAPSPHTKLHGQRPPFACASASRAVSESMSNVSKCMYPSVEKRSVGSSGAFKFPFIRFPFIKFPFITASTKLRVQGGRHWWAVGPLVALYHSNMSANLAHRRRSSSPTNAYHHPSTLIITHQRSSSPTKATHHPPQHPFTPITIARNPTCHLTPHIHTLTIGRDIYI